MNPKRHDYYDLESFNPSRAALYNVPRLRTDIWHFLRDNARRLRQANRRQLDENERLWLISACAEAIDFLKPLEEYCAFPGRQAVEQIHTHFQRKSYDAFASQTIRLVRLLTTGAYRQIDLTASPLNEYSDLLNVTRLSEEVHARIRQERRPYFESLVVDDISGPEETELHHELRALRRRDDAFLYEVVVVRTFEDALIAAAVNPNIQSCVIRSSVPYFSNKHLRLVKECYKLLDSTPEQIEPLMPTARSLRLGRALKSLRPELDLFLVTDAPVEDVAGSGSHDFRRVFYHQESFRDMHLSILKGIHERFATPFFTALKRYSLKPTGMFHALPISRAATITKSHWIQDMGEFYGHNIFQAETSATTGGLDSLLQPHGSLREAQESAARAFGSRRTYFVTNGTSTANKIVMQALVGPGDIVLLAHDCHKSHPYAVILSGAHPIYLDAYPLSQYSMYGAVPLAEIKRQLLDLKRAGKLDRVRMLLLTNITFDGVAYDPLRIMEEVLAIKPDMVFLWDEAWYAFARFSPILRRRSAMWAAERLRERLRSNEYRRQYREWRDEFRQRDAEDAATWLDRRLLPDPEHARVRVYVTQSTHKTLTALRQGSMIHIHDQDFDKNVRYAFNEGYMTHTSTSPNYQILASLDVGRRQVELEGYELVGNSIELAMTLRERIHSDEQLKRYFHVVRPMDMIPPEFRPSGLNQYYDPATGWGCMDEAWKCDEFVLDPTRITLHIGRTGMDGDTFKKLLMDRYDIQLNKTSRNTVLLMIHIGMTRGTVAHLVKVLTQIAQDLDDKLDRWSTVECELFEQRVHSLTEDLPPLPNFSRFHPAFLTSPDSETPEGDMRKAFFLAYNDSFCEYRKFDRSLSHDVEAGGEVVSAGFVTPYPPGFPILVPGQIITSEILAFLRALDVKEIHGYEPDFGLRVFTPAALLSQTSYSDGAVKRRLRSLQAQPAEPEGAPQ